MRQHIAIAIAALMITSMAFAISTTSVSATHATPTISISPDFVKGGESYVFTLSVTNEGGDPIDRVEITQSHLTGIEQIVKLPKDNIVKNANVTLSDGTQVTVVAASVTVVENTVVSLPAGTLIVAPSGDNAELYEDGTAEMIASENAIPGMEESVGMEGSVVSVTSEHLCEIGEENENYFNAEPETLVVDDMTFDAQTPETVTIEGEISALTLGVGWPNTAYVEIGVRPDNTKDERNAGVYMIFFSAGEFYFADLQDYTGQQSGNQVTNIVKGKEPYTYKITLTPSDNIGGTAALDIWDNDSTHYGQISLGYGYASTWDEGVPGDNNEDFSEAHLFYSIIADRRGTGGENYSATVGDITTNVTSLPLEAEEVTVKKQGVTLSENALRLLADTLAAASLWLPEDTPAEVPDDVGTNVAGDMTLVADDTVTLPDDSAADVRLLANTLILYTSGSAKGIIAPLGAGSEVDLRGSEDVVLPAGTTVTGDALVTVAENEDITISADTTVVLAAGTVPENVPEDWSFSDNAWSSTEDNIAVGETVEFPFAATAPAGSSWSITVKTTDVNNYEALVVIEFTADGVAPSVTATVSPDPTNSAVTITVEASEELSELGEVTVKQHNAAEENVFTIEMTSADGINWTGTYTVISNHDGAAVVAIENSTDLVGNAGGENASVATFDVDTVAPDAPRVGTADLNDLPDFTEQPNQLVHGTAIDVAEVLVRVNADVTSVTPRADNGYSVAITLVEGPNEVGVSFADEAGNESEENVQDVFVDSLAPTVDMVSIAGKVYEENMPIDNNTPIIVVRMDDLGYPDTGSGIPYANVSVELLDENGTWMADLDNATPWENSGLWENAYPTELDDGAYIVAVSAHDEINDPTEENFTFVVDTIAPEIETPFLSELPTELVDERDHIIRGYAEANSTIKVYAASTLTLIDQGKADSSGYYRFTVTLPKGTHDIYVSATDAAGNESDKVLYGTVTVTITPVPPVDTVAPVVSITAPEAEATTDEASIVIVGKVSELAEWTVSAPSGIQSGMTDSAGNFSASIALVEGTNTIIVTAVDAAGNPSAPVSIEVTRTVVPLETYAIVLVILLVVLVAIAVLKR